MDGPFYDDKGKEIRGPRYYRWNDPQNNIIESETNLALWDSNKFERYDGPLPDYITDGSGIPPEMPPPPPPNSEAVAKAADMSRARTPVEAKAYAAELRKRADDVEEAAEQAEKDAEVAKKGEATEATEHQRGMMAKSDSRDAQEKDWEDTKKAIGKDAKASAKDDDDDDEEDELDDMSVAELRKKAEDSEIDLTGKRSRKEILKALRGKG